MPTGSATAREAFSMGAPPGELADDLRHRRRAEILATVRAASDRLFGWQSEAGLAALVDEIASLADDLGDLCGLTGFHRERAFKPWREAWALAHLMPVTEAEAARLVPDDGRGSTPDAELRTAKGILPVEITEGISSSHDPANDRSRASGSTASRRNGGETPRRFHRSSRRLRAARSTSPTRGAPCSSCTWEPAQPMALPTD